MVLTARALAVAAATYGNAERPARLTLDARALLAEWKPADDAATRTLILKWSRLHALRMLAGLATMTFVAALA